MSKIEWKITEQNLSQELVSQDNRWHIFRTQKGKSEPEFFSFSMEFAPDTARNRHGLPRML